MNVKGKSILLVDHDAHMRQLMKEYLVADGYEVWEAKDGEEATRTIEKDDPCFLITELSLPARSGESVCRFVRQELKNEMPMIIVTEKTSEDDRINGLRLGADDYITKPFSPKELVARVDTVLRRTANRCNKMMYRGITLKPFKGEVKLDGDLLHLTKNEFQLLYQFMQHPNHILSREQLLDRLYPNDEKVVTKRTIDVHIASLREKLQARTNDSTYIETIRGIGYRFQAY